MAKRRPKRKTTKRKPDPKPPVHALTEYEFLDLVLEVVEKAFGVPDVTVRNRRRRISEARSVAMYLARELTDCSYPTIADIFDRDHTTVMHADRRISGRVLNSEQFAAVMHRLKQTIHRESIARSDYNGENP